MKLHFQFKPEANQTDQKRLAGELKAAGARTVEPLFAGETDPQLALLQVVEADDPHEDKLLRHLNASSCVQFAEREVKRKLG